MQWAKIGMVIPFDKPLPSDGIRCDYKYGNIDGFQLDTNAPIFVSNDGEKAAQAYVPGSDDAEVSGSAIETDYKNSEGSVLSGFVRLILRYFEADDYLELELSSGPAGVSLGFNPSAFGIGNEAFSAAAAEAGVEHSEVMPLEDLIDLDELSLAVLNGTVGQDFVIVYPNEGAKMGFSDVELQYSISPLIMVDQDGGAIAVTPVHSPIPSRGGQL